MGCASSVNVQIEENKDNRKIISNGKEVGNIKKTDNGKDNNNNNDKIEERSEENHDEDEDYLEMPSIKKTNNENSQSKTIVNMNLDNKPNIHNIKITDNIFNNKSTNYKYLKDNKINLIKSNPIINANTNPNNPNNNNNQVKNSHSKFIPLKHPLDMSSENKGSELRYLKISMEKENENGKKKNNNDIYGVNNSIEERINNYHGNINNNRDNDDEDGVNMGNYGDGDNDDMCNFGQSMDNKKVNEVINNQKELTIIFDIQSTGEKYNINVNQGIKLNDLFEKFKKKIDLSSFERPEFMFNGVYLIDYDKSIEDYNITDKSKINVYI